MKFLDRPRSAGDVEHRADEHAVHVPQKHVGLDPELQRVAFCTPLGRDHTGSGSAVCSVSVGVNAVKSCLPTIALAQLRSASRSSSPSTRTRACARTRCGCAARARGSSRSCWLRPAERRSDAGAGSEASTARSSAQQPVQPQRIDRLVRVACDLPPGVHAAVGASGHRQLQRLAVVCRSRREPCAGPARAPPARSACPAGAPSRRSSVPSYSIVSLVTIPAQRPPRARRQTSSMKTISVASLLRGPSFRMRV